MVLRRDSKNEDEHVSVSPLVIRDAWYAAVTIIDSKASLRTFSPSDSSGRVRTRIFRDEISSAAFNVPVTTS